MSAPTVADWSVLLRLARYLVLRSPAVYSFPWQDEGVAIRTFADTDFAGRFRARRSTCGGVCVRGVHTMKHWPTTPKTITLSS
eukprot:3664172-Alexandrium_andersonii.AAC.1